MKFSTVAVMSLGLLAAAALADEKAAPKTADSGLADVRQKASYGLGLGIGKNLAGQVGDLDPELIAQGIRDAFGGKPPRLTDQEIQTALVAYQQELMNKKTKEGEAFLAENKKKPGVLTLPSGLQYKVIKEGTGKVPKPTDTVSVNYEGKLIDNTVFDSSTGRGAPATFQVGQVIPGFSEALKLMKVGSKWQVYIPANLAYGPTPPQGSKIPPNAPLVFDLELIEVK
jgi:FKBP-type peptidyl-prolyl cis-trans isomerase